MPWRPVYAVLEREVVRMFRQRTRLVAAMVRPLIWLFVIGAGFGAVLGRASGLSYQQFLVPGVLGMTMLFGAMLAALTVVYDKESGVMRMLIIAPFAHYWIVIGKMAGGAGGDSSGATAADRARLAGIRGPETRLGILVIGLIATSLACAGIGMLVAAFADLDNFAAIMNFVIFGILPVRLALSGEPASGAAQVGGPGKPLHLRRRPAQARHARRSAFRHGSGFPAGDGSCGAVELHAGSAVRCQLALLTGKRLRADDPHPHRQTRRLMPDFLPRRTRRTRRKYKNEKVNVG
jgi:hypothetical protein